MPLPENSRLTFYKYQPETPADHFANLRETDRWGSQLPFFGRKIYKNSSVGTWSTGSLTYTPFGGGTFTRISNFKKYYSWTDLHVTVFASGFMPSVFKADLGVRLTGASSGVQTTEYVTHQFFNTINNHTTLAGEALFSANNSPSTAKIADTYSVDLMVKVSGGTFQTDVNDHVSLSIIECIPYA